MKPYNNVRRLAQHDISEYFKGVKSTDENHDTWLVTSTSLHCIENQRLNRELELHKVNKFNNKNGCKL